MNAEDIIYDVMEIQGLLEDDTDIDESWILHKLNSYRAILIAEEYKVNPVIDPAWLQPVEKFNLTKVTPADDPAITISSLSIGRTIISDVVSLPDDLGMYRVSGSGGIIGFEPTDFDSLIAKAYAEEDMHPGFGYYSRVGTMLYVYPYILEGKALIIAANPMDVQFWDGSAYRDMELTDRYPLDARLAQMAVLQILTVDLKLNTQAITDIVNDSQSALKIMKNERPVQGG